MPQKTVTPAPTAGPKKPVMPSVPKELPNLPPKVAPDTAASK